MRTTTTRGASRRGALAAALLALAAPALSGCFGVGAPAAIAAGSTATIIAENKMPTDILTSAVTGQDCDYIRHVEDQGPYCRPKERRVIEKPIYCYRTLGDVNCYERRDPYGVGQRTVN